MSMGTIQSAQTVPADIQFIGVGEDSGSSSVTPAIPGGAAADDLMMLVFIGRDDVSTPAAPGGWTNIFTDALATGTGRTVAVWTKVHSGSESDPEVTYADASEEIVAFLLVYRGVDGLDVTYSLASHRQQGKDTKNPTCKAITTVTNAARVVLIHGAVDDSSTLYSDGGAPDGYNLRASYHAAVLIAGFVADKVVGTAGTETPGAWNHTSSASTQDYSCFTLALKPA